jgi:hypothetical protein
MTDEILKVADHAAVQTDRWMLVVVLLAMLAAVVFIWRWMVNDRDKLGRRLTEITDRHIAMGEKMTEVVTNNTEALKEVRAVVNYCRNRNLNG